MPNKGYFKSGDEWNGNAAGRPVGSKNKQTQAIRQAYQELVEGNLENLNIWLATVAEKDPKEAFEMMIKLSEYVIPKLARTELTGQDGDDLFKSIRFDFGPDINDTTNRKDFDIDEV